LHIVDLDGAKEGQPVNGASVRRIVAEVRVPCQVGGGFRTEAHIAEALSWGVERVVIGTRALKDPEWLRMVCDRFPHRIVAGIDAKEGRVATDGWLAVSQQPALELARHIESWPLAGLVYTDISKDGMLEGPNLAAIAELAGAVRLPVIASGGISSLDDVRQLAGLGLAGCIIGRALYEGRISLTDVLEVTQSTLQTRNSWRSTV